MPKKIGIVKEKKNAWERRVPLIPADVKTLIASQGVEIVIQPSRRRIFSDDEFRAAGAIVQEDLSECDPIFGIKEIKIADLIPEKTYLYFSHTIKGQPYNMPMLQKVLELRCTLLDYERMVDENNQRLIYFSYHAGVAGVIESLWAYGQRLSWEGISSPFSIIKQSFKYDDQAAAEAAFAALGNEISRNGLPLLVLPGMGTSHAAYSTCLVFCPLKKLSRRICPLCTNGKAKPITAYFR